MDTKSNKEFRADIDSFDVCMLATRDGAHLRSRPMAPHVNEPDGTIRFLTSERTHKIAEIETNPQANAVFVDDDGKYISVSGRVRLSNDKADIDALWSPAAAPWFENGKEEALVLILDPEIAEYWDNTSNKLKAGWEMVKGSITGNRPDVGEHEKKSL